MLSITFDQCVIKQILQSRQRKVLCTQTVIRIISVITEQAIMVTGYTLLLVHDITQANGNLMLLVDGVEAQALMPSYLRDNI